MALHFVSTSVLSSADGIAFETEVKKDSEDVRRAQAAAAAARAKPLFEQLAEQQLKKQEEYDANTKLIFAPPRALDEEDEQFFSALADSQNKRKQLRELEEEKEVASFRKHMQSSDSSAAPKFKLTHDKPVSVTAPAVPAPVVIVKKRKIEDAVKEKTSSTEFSKSSRTQNSSVGPSEGSAPAVTPNTSGSQTVLKLQSLLAYGSDSEESYS